MSKISFYAINQDLSEKIKKELLGANLYIK